MTPQRDDYVRGDVVWDIKLGEARAVIVLDAIPLPHPSLERKQWTILRGTRKEVVYRLWCDDEVDAAVKWYTAPSRPYNEKVTDG